MIPISLLSPESVAMSKDEIIYGCNPVCELIKAGRRDVREVIIAAGKKDSSLARLEGVTSRSRIKLRTAQRHEIDSMAEGKKHQGVIAKVSSYPYVDISELLACEEVSNRRSVIAILDGITDPQNLGSIVRSAHLLGVSGIIIPKDNSAAITASVVKASAGATEHCKIAQVTNLVREIKNLKDKGFWIFGAEGDGGQDLYSLDFKGENLSFVMGSEGKGMRRLVRESCDHLIAIPMRGKIDSFNASAAAAIIMSEISRQRLLEGSSK